MHFNFLLDLSGFYKVYYSSDKRENKIQTLNIEFTTVLIIFVVSTEI